MRVVVFLALLSLPAAAGKILVADVKVDKALRLQGSAVADTVAGAVSRAGHDVVTTQQLEALIGLEAARQLAGCGDDACLAKVGVDIAGALGVDAVITASATKVGSGTLVAVKRIGARDGAGKVADARIKSTRLEQILDALPPLVIEVLGGVSAATTTTPPTTPTALVASAPHLPAGLVASPPVKARADVPLTLTKEQRAALKVVDDGNGRLIAYNAERPLSGPLLAGQVGGPLYAQRVIGGGSDGSTGSFSITFWDPRFNSGAERGVDSKDGVVTLTCGPTKTTYKPATKAVADKALAKVHDVAWQRQLVLVGRDDDLAWYLVDDARDSKDGSDMRVYVGKKVKGARVDGLPAGAGAYVFSPLAGEIVRDASFGDGVLVVGDGYKLKLGAGGGELQRGADKTALVVLPLFDHAADVYRVMQPWGEPRLGTPCDP